MEGPALISTWAICGSTKSYPYAEPQDGRWQIQPSTRPLPPSEREPSAPVLRSPAGRHGAPPSDKALTDDGDQYLAAVALFEFAASISLKIERPVSIGSPPSQSFAEVLRGLAKVPDEILSVIPEAQRAVGIHWKISKFLDPQ
jgi:hypothetical protein